MTVENTPELMSAKILNLPDAARVWVYQSTRPFSEKETVVLKSQINGFVSEWTAHSQQLAAAGDVLMNQFIVLAVDEKQAGASGCSIDKSVHFLQSIENPIAAHVRAKIKNFDVQTFIQKIFSRRNARRSSPDNAYFFHT